MKRSLFIILPLCSLALCFHSCKEYMDDLTSLGSRVEVLEDEYLHTFKDNLALIQHLIQISEGKDYVKDIQYNEEDDSYTISFASNPEQVFVIKNGTNGEPGKTGKSDTMGIVQIDGIWYWTINEELTNPPVAITAKNGDNGVDANRDDIVVPRIRISAGGYWQIYSEEQGRWVDLVDQSTGESIKAKGESGAYAVITDVEFNEDKTIITFILKDGTRLTLNFKTGEVEILILG